MSRALTQHHRDLKNDFWLSAFGSRQDLKPALKTQSPETKAQSLFEQPTPERAAIGGNTLRRVQLHVQPPLFEGFNLFRRQIDRTRELSAGGLCDCEVADGCTACALGDTAMEPGHGR